VETLLAGRFSAESLRIVRGSTAESGDIACAWTGRFQGLDGLASELGLEPSGGPGALLAAAYRRLGTDLLSRLRGAFVLALWDRERRRGLIGTDLLGQCGLYWSQTAGELHFASEVRDLLPLLSSRPEPDELSVVHMLTRYMPPRGHTMYAGVRRLECGFCLELEDAGSRLVRHWRPRYEPPPRGSRDELAETLRDGVISAVSRSLDGADSAAVFLSGGIDSSITASIASALGAEVRGYSAVFPGQPDVDESRYIDSIVEHAGIASRRFAIEPRGYLATSLEYLRAWETPVGGPGYLLEVPLATAAAEDGMGIVLDGQGGNEVFGTTAYVAADDLRRGRLLRSIRTSQSTPWTANVRTRRARFALWRSAALNPLIPDAPFAAVRRIRGREAPAPAFLTPAGQQAYLDSVDDRDWKRSGDGPLGWRFMVELMIFAAGGARCDYLRHRAAMVGLEARPSLLDIDLALLTLRLPPHLAMDPSRDRPLARDAMKGILPEDLRTRTDKSDLSAFYRRITIQGDIGDLRRLLLQPDCEVYRYVDRERIMAIAKRPPDDGRLASQAQVEWLQACATMEYWLRRQCDPDSTDRLLEQLEPPTYREAAATPVAAS
jgi:asparagine synthase (glutamine-hydrolysing)